MCALDVKNFMGGKFFKIWVEKILEGSEPYFTLIFTIENVWHKSNHLNYENDEIKWYKIDSP